MVAYFGKHTGFRDMQLYFFVALILSFGKETQNPFFVGFTIYLRSGKS